MAHAIATGSFQMDFRTWSLFFKSLNHSRLRINARVAFPRTPYPSSWTLQSTRKSCIGRHLSNACLLDRYVLIPSPANSAIQRAPNQRWFLAWLRKICPAVSDSLFTVSLVVSQDPRSRSIAVPKCFFMKVTGPSGPQPSPLSGWRHSFPKCSSMMRRITT